MNEDSWALDNFGGVGRLFPLPNLVMFPHVVQPLHIFEPRYRDMTADALAGDHLIAMALLRPEWEHDYEGRPAIDPVICLCRIVADQKLDDGRYLLLLRGLTRGRVAEELAPEKLYRQARIELTPERFELDLAQSRRFRGELSELILPHFAGSDNAAAQVRDLFQGETPLGTLCDCLSYQLPLELARKQELLAEAEVGQRAQKLIAALREVLPSSGSAGASNRSFPPDFSLN